MKGFRAKELDYLWILDCGGKVQVSCATEIFLKEA